ncbi:hypothetical protein JTE90_004108 [Oedothorax gibbosus]|uniref:Uncharacterized protein n=1 Tax=Oedothorax gibbosus TaxID=931172 RepID=A0AAV6V3T0_9ARAC|nr:hypothetical protein JTE90_004108 [Oedothorax gibbosus]
MSRFAIVPILRGKTNSAVSDRLIAALKSSSFCSSNPIIKKLLLQNVHVWCIVIETSGTQSIKVICASVPYLLNLLSRANPKFKQILEDEKVASYLKFFQETDMESVLASLCTATVIIQKGIRMCQPTLCVQLSRDALMFGNTTLKAVLEALYNGIMSAFHFLWEDLGPACHSFCSRNRVFLKYIAANLPVFALAIAKSLVLLSFSVRRIFQVGLKLAKRFDVSRAVVIVLKDSNRAFIEVSAVSYSASSQLFVAAKSFSKQAPIALYALNKVAVGTSNALIEVSLTSIKAHNRMLKDFKNGAQIVKSSIKSAELEFVAVIDEVVVEINDTVADSPDLIALTQALIIQKTTTELDPFKNLSRPNINDRHPLMKAYSLAFKQSVNKRAIDQVLQERPLWKENVIKNCLISEKETIWKKSPVGLETMYGQTNKSMSPLCSNGPRQRGQISRVYISMGALSFLSGKSRERIMYLMNFVILLRIFGLENLHIVM